MQAGELDTYMKETMTSIHSVTVGKRRYRVYRYEGPLNGIARTVVLSSYFSDAFGDSAALKAFLCTDCSMSIEEILGAYTERWPVEVFFYESKQKLGLIDIRFDPVRVSGVFGYSCPLPILSAA